MPMTHWTQYGVGEGVVQLRETAWRWQQAAGAEARWLLVPEGLQPWVMARSPS